MRKLLVSGSGLDPKVILALAALVHLFTTTALVAAGKMELLPGTIGPSGLLAFAPDGDTYWGTIVELREEFLAGGLRDWLISDAAFQEFLHVRAYSVCHILFRPLLGDSLLAMEPLNLLLFVGLVGLTFKLTDVVFDRRAASLAAIATMLLPSLLLHTTQLLKTSFVIVLVLSILIVCALALRTELALKRGLLLGAGGALAMGLTRVIRVEFVMLVAAGVAVALLLLVYRQISERRLWPGSVLAVCMVLLGAVPVPDLVPFGVSGWASGDRPAGEVATIRLVRLGSLPAGGVRDQNPKSPAGLLDSIVEQLDTSRRRFTANPAGSTLDPDVRLDTFGDVLAYTPRAMLIGLFAPFPSAWIEEGVVVGRLGRLLIGLETSMMYGVTLLAAWGLFRNRRDPVILFLGATILLGVTTLALAVPNWGTLYRLRYPFWILMMVLGAGFVTTWEVSGRGSFRAGRRASEK